jgi:DNA primase
VFTQVLETALIAQEALQGLGMPDFIKTTGSKGLHVSVPIVRGPTQKDDFAALARQ